jgi:hypothetical protein
MSGARSVDSEPLSRRAALWRAMNTPIRELLRGHIADPALQPASSAAPPATIVASAKLPVNLAGLVLQVVRASRLWRRERADVARELVAHFADGLASGESSESLAQSFGDPANAARLIRRAKKRNRPLWWRAAKRVLQAMALLIVLYLLLAARFFLSSPTISHDYLADLRGLVSVQPEHERAWPIYREALIGLGKLPMLDDDNWHLLKARPGEAHWEIAEAYLAEHAPQIAQIREASRLPVFGFALGAPLSAEDQKLWPDMNTTYRAPGEIMENSVVGLLLPYLSEVRKLGTVLVSDARRAAAAGHGATALEDLTAIVALTQQLRFLPILIQDLVANAVLAVACEGALDILAQHPQVFSDAQLQELAHRFAGVRDDDLTVRLAGERMFFEDIVQRLYTDNGNGDGHLSGRSLRVLQWLVQPIDPAGPDVSNAIELAAWPAVGLFAQSRREILSDYHALMNQIEAEAAQPLWMRDVSKAEMQIEEWAASPWQKKRRLPLVLLMPAISKASQTSELIRMRRDAVTVVIALELYRRTHGHWPATLDELSPALLPTVPRDRFDGQPLKYALIDGQPVLYCVGSDGNDDGGHAPVDINGVPNASAASRWVEPSKRSRVVGTGPRSGGGLWDGDWILWPPIPEPPSPPVSANQMPRE